MTLKKSFSTNSLIIEVCISAVVYVKKKYCYLVIFYFPRAGLCWKV